MRLFIAIELPTEIKDSLARLQQEFKKTGADVKWVEPQNIHLTLKFIGETEEDKLREIIQSLKETAGGKPAFKMRIASCGAFPKISSPRVIWASLDKGDKETKEIAQELENRLVMHGIPKEERDFSSHITIGRTRSGLNRDKLVSCLNTLAGKPEEETKEFTISKITLFKSTLTPKGPIYEALQEASLKTT